MHMVYPCSKSTIRCWGSYFSIVLEMLNNSHQQKHTDEEVETSEPSQSQRGHFFFFYKKKNNNCMIKITYKCKVLPLKLDCVFWNSLILTNLKGIHCYSTFWHASLTIWQESMKSGKYWQELSISTCMMEMAVVTMRMLHEHWMTSLTTCVCKSIT